MCLRVCRHQRVSLSRTIVPAARSLILLVSASADSIPVLSLALWCCCCRDGEAWLVEVAGEDGVTRLPSGLLYRVESSGEGAHPTKESRVQVHYRGTLQDGTTFDSSYDRGSPATFGVTQVIRGWTEALLLMREGDKCTQTAAPHRNADRALSQCNDAPPLC